MQDNNRFIKSLNSNEVGEAYQYKMRKKFANEEMNKNIGNNMIYHLKTVPLEKYLLKKQRKLLINMNGLDVCQFVFAIVMDCFSHH